MASRTPAIHPVTTTASAVQDTQLQIDIDDALNLVQLGVWPNQLKHTKQTIQALLSIDLPNPRSASGTPPLRALWIGPRRFWITSQDAALHQKLTAELTTQAAVTLDLSHSRTRIRLAGKPVRTVLAKALPVDLHPQAFPVNRVISSIMHNISISLDYLGEDCFDIYVPRTFALSFFEALQHSAHEFGYQISNKLRA